MSPTDPAEQSARLARTVYDAIRDNDLLDLDPAVACGSLEALADALKAAGDPLGRFAVTELLEGARNDDGSFNLGRATLLLHRAAEDLLGVSRSLIRYAVDHPEECGCEEDENQT